MRIGIDCRLWGETGVGRYIRNLVLELSKLDTENNYVLFALSKDREKILKQVQNDKFKIVESNIRWHTVEEQFKLPQILNKENLDLVHFPYFSVPISYNRPFVITIHDLIMNHFSTGQASTLPTPIYNLKLLGYKFIIAQAAKKAKKIITVSNATKEEVIDHLKVDSKKITVTYEGIDQKITNPKSQIPNKFQIPNSKVPIKKYFLYVGNAYPHKNLARLLESFKTLTADINLVLVGKDDYFYKRLRRKVKEMNLSDKIIFLQNVSDEELSYLYKNALALIIPSLMEGFGLPALEAMANNCLVLVSDIPSLKEICGDAALHFNPLSVEELSEKLNMIALHTTEYAGLNEIRKKGIERAKMFSWEKMAMKTLKVYESCVGL